MGETNNKEIILLKVKVAQLCRVWLFATPLVCGHHALPHPPWDSPGKNIGLGSHSLLQGIFPTQGSNSGILDCRWILYHLSHHLKAKGLSKGSPLKTLTFKPGRLQSRGSQRVRYNWATSLSLSLVVQMVNNLPAMQETRVQSLGQEDPLEKKMATHSSILAWRIPRTEEPGGPQSLQSQRVKQDWVTNT